MGISLNKLIIELYTQVLAEEDAKLLSLASQLRATQSGRCNCWMSWIV